MEKLPLGVIPERIYEIKRIQDLCRAIGEYAGHPKADYKYMEKWVDELHTRVYMLCGMEDIVQPEKVVLCRDCIHSEEMSNNNNIGENAFYCKAIEGCFNGDFFCRVGKQK